METGGCYRQIRVICFIELTNHVRPVRLSMFSDTDKLQNRKEDFNRLL
jgi:hypothetical protein